MFYRGTIRLAAVHQSRLARILAGNRVAIGSRSRRLTPDAHALLVLAHLRNGDTYRRLADGFDVGVATVYRYVQEAITLLAALAPSLTAALWRLCWSGHQYAILDGTCVPIDRLGGPLNRLYYCGKHHRHTVNLQALVDPAATCAGSQPSCPVRPTT